MTGTCKTVGSKSWARLGVALFAVLGLAGAAAAQGAASLTSDAGDYPPGATATLTGAGFGAGDTVTVQVVHADGSPSTGTDHDPWDVVADANGGFVTTWHVCEDDCVGETLLATADGAPSGEHAQTTFTDAGPMAGTGHITSVVPIGPGCTVQMTPGGQVESWNIEPGKS